MERAIPAYQIGRLYARQSTDRIPLSEAPTIARRETLKKQTSRIILTDASSAPVPQTIKLKRPSVTTDEEPTAIAPLEEQVMETARKSETTRIDLVADAVAPVPLTERKTIKIKRTERNVIPRTVTMTRAEAAAARKAEKEMAPSVSREEEKMGAFFSLVAVVCVLLSGAIAYLMAAQLFAPGLVLPLPSFLIL